MTKFTNIDSGEVRYGELVGSTTEAWDVHELCNDFETLQQTPIYLQKDKWRWQPYFSQYGEDFWLDRNGLLPVIGTFCEVGVGHWQDGSNTLFCERLGWKGMLIEPDPRAWAGIIENRRADLVKCAIGDGGLSTEFHLAADPTLSGINRDGDPIVVPLRRLNEILGTTKIDLLSIDTEGTELDVWSSYTGRPRIVIVEYLTIGLPSNAEAVRARFEADGYRLAHTTEANFIFVWREYDDHSTEPVVNSVPTV